jgi:prepilin-type N-terminal cleavage/methylation domain-containing protein
MMKINKRNPIGGGGFTLVELLVVIAIIGVLMGIVVVVLNPAQILIRSRQGVCKANVGRVCEASAACYVAMNDVTLCDTAAETGATLPSSPCAVSITATTGVVTATQDGCTYSCDPTTGIVSQTGTTCYTPD